MTEASRSGTCSRGPTTTPTVWGIHSTELATLAAYCRERGITLLAVVFPMLQAPAQSAPFSAKVSGFLIGQGVRVLDLGPVLRDAKPGELVLNPQDAHPNEALHRQVGEMLASFVAASTAPAQAAAP